MYTYIFSRYVYKLYKQLVPQDVFVFYEVVYIHFSIYI